MIGGGLSALAGADDPAVGMAIASTVGAVLSYAAFREMAASRDHAGWEVLSFWCAMLGAGLAALVTLHDESRAVAGLGLAGAGVAGMAAVGITHLFRQL